MLTRRYAAHVYEKLPLSEQSAGGPYVEKAEPIWGWDDQTQMLF